MAKFLDYFGGNDSNDGNSWATAWQTIDKALTSAISDIFWIKPGIYTLETTKSLLRDRSPKFVGLGGVIFRSIGENTAWQVPLRDYNTQTTYFQNIVFSTPDILRVQTGYPFVHQMFFENCSFVNSSVIVSAIASTGWKFINCSFEGALPVNGVTLSSDQGPFKFIAPDQPSYAVYNETLKLNVNENLTASDMGLLVNNDAALGANPIRPEAVQYDSLGPGFVTADLLPIGIVQRHNLTYSSADIRKNFSSWCVDPTGPAGTFVFSDDVGITLSSGDGARVLSPVQYYSRGISLSRVKISALEYGFGGVNQVLDSTPLDATRTLEYRISDTPFTQTDVAPTWVTAERNTDLGPIAGKYIQLRVTFNLEAA